MLQEQGEGPYCPEACGDDLQDDIYLAAGGNETRPRWAPTQCLCFLSKYRVFVGGPARGCTQRDEGNVRLVWLTGLIYHN